MSTYSEIAKELLNNNVRLEGIFIPALTYCGGGLDDSCALHEAVIQGDLDKMFPEIKKLSDVASDEGYGEELLNEYIGDYLVSLPSSILVGKFSTPVPDYSGKYLAYSWGYTQSEWLIGNSMEELLQKALLWYGKIHKKAKAGK